MTASGTFKDDIYNRLEGLKAEGLYKFERVIASPQRAEITLQDGQEVINLCANNYLGLADDPAVIAAAHAALDREYSSSVFDSSTPSLRRAEECLMPLVRDAPSDGVTDAVNMFANLQEDQCTAYEDTRAAGIMGLVPLQ